MGTYNLLIAEVTCAHCGVKYDTRIQFKYGLLWLIEYQPGDTIQWDTSRWNGRYDAGSAALKKVKVYGSNELDECPLCNRKTVEEFDIFIERNIITSFSPMETYQCYLESDIDDNGDYVLLEA
ncbi:hypothetical protein [Chitinophaga barathri]|uniref:Uncharacterized protein n=1 Tax=Chitinophaga barathri TaxID=1647451 RepID=A0A3N4MJ39_9BACT|nr:hypothetical protein [Chitinophaga barathri]RPD39699.1 hypothetical protein EG028_18840 [Chitinophaga barathri]